MCSELSGTSKIGDRVRWAAPETLKPPENGESPTPVQLPSDIYSFGCIIFKVMTDRPPYADVQNDNQVIHLIIGGIKPTRPPSPHIIDSLWNFIEECWSDAACRPSAAEVVRSLGLYDEHQESLPTQT